VAERGSDGRGDGPVNGGLGVGAHYKGSLNFEGRVRIDGWLEGDVRSPDLLEIGAAGRVKGSVHVAQALVGGRLEGTLHATERVTLLETAVVEGTIHTPWIDVRPGARWVGRIEVER